MAAGRGTRLHPLTIERPKCLIEVSGRALLDHLLEEFSDWADRVVVVTGHAHSALHTHLEQNTSYREIILVHNDQYEKTNSLSSAALSLPYWDDSSEVVITNSDVIFGAGALRPLLASEHACVVAVVEKPWDIEDMKVRVDRDKGEILEVSKEIPPTDSFGEFTGVVKLSGDGLRIMRATIEEMLSDSDLGPRVWYDLAIDRVARRGGGVRYVLISDDKYAEIDTLEDLEDVRRRF